MAKKKVQKKSSPKKTIAKKSSQSSKNTSPRYVWALDPFAKDLALLSKTSRSLKLLVEKTGCEIEPVYVLSPDGFNWTGDFSGAWVKKFEPIVKEAMNKVIQNAGLKTLEPVILVSKGLSLRKDVKKLLDHAQKVKAQALVLNTHGRTGISRFFMGSFAETAMLQSKKPILLMNSEARELTRLAKIVFPTDLSKESKKAFKVLIQRCKAWGAEIHIFHKVPDAIEPMIQTGVHLAGGGWISINQYLESEAKERQAECEKLALEAKKSGVQAMVYVEEGAGFVSDLLNGYATGVGADMIMLASKSGVLSSVLIGSIARQMARSSSLPLWVQHYDAK